jgi:serine protease Do
VNTATVGRGELGFAIPIDAVKAIIPQLYTGGAPNRGWLGVQIRPLHAAKADALGLAMSRGVYVHDVLDDQPAQQAGIQVGDVIVRFDGKSVATPFDLQSVVAGTPVGARVQVQVFRKASLHTVELTVGTMPTSR